MPRKKQITQCRATTLCKKKVLEHGCFCVDHELLWIAKSGEPSARIRNKHKKVYQQFQRQQDREFVAAEHERIEAVIRERKYVGEWSWRRTKIHKALENRGLACRQPLNPLVGVIDDVHDAALYGFGEHAPAPADRNFVLVVDDGAEGRAPRGDWGLSTSAYEPAGEGQPEVPAPDVHRSGK